MKHPMLIAAALVAAASVSGCGSSKKENVVVTDTSRFYMHVGPGGILYSPNGEPLSGGPLGNPDCVKALTGWFERVDADHDGTIDRTEMIQDARVQFLRMDKDGDGAVYPNELLAFRTPYEVAVKRNTTLVTEDDPSDKGKKKPNIKSDVSDPVMSADTNLDFKVTLDEMIVQAKDIFKTLDHDTDGKLEKAEVIAACPPGL